MPTVAVHICTCTSSSGLMYVLHVVAALEVCSSWSGLMFCMRWPLLSSVRHRQDACGLTLQFVVRRHIAALPFSESSADFIRDSYSIASMAAGRRNVVLHIRPIPELTLDNTVMFGLVKKPA